MIPAPAHMVATYSNDDERPVHAYDDAGFPLTPNSSGRLVRADNWPGFKGVDQRVDTAPTMAVPGQGWQIETTYKDGTTRRTPVVAFMIDHSGYAVPLAQEEDEGGIWQIDVGDTTRLTANDVRLIAPGQAGATPTVEGWVTVSVTAMPPGWWNVYANDDDPTDPAYTPCPAILLQEFRSGPDWWGTPAIRPTRRTVFGDYDIDQISITPACEVTNYVETVWNGDGPPDLVGAVK